MISVRWTLLFIGYVSLSFIVAGCAGTSSRLPRTLSPSEKNANLEKYFEQTKDIDYIIKALKDEDNMVRMTAARILGESRDRRAVEPLVSALRTDRNYAVREEAALTCPQLMYHL
jgi:HEAT repeat protein